MGAANAKINQLGLAVRSQHASGRLAGKEDLLLKKVDDARLDELGLAEGRCDADDRFVLEKNGALGHSMDIAGKTHRGQVIDQPSGESAAGREIGQFVLRKTQLLQEGDDRFQTAEARANTVLLNMTGRKMKGAGGQGQDTQMKFTNPLA